MYKRKRLFDRGDSYRDTGIPCGNPKRVQTGEVLCMPGGAARAAAAAQAAEGVKTQGEEHLRVMAQRQLNTKMSMQELSSQRRQFRGAGRYKPVLREVRGVLRLTDYQAVARGDERVATLRQCGLTDEEVRLQLDREGTSGEHTVVVSVMWSVSFGQWDVVSAMCVVSVMWSVVSVSCGQCCQCHVGTKKGSYGTNPAVEEDRLRNIDRKIQEKEASLAAPDTFRGLKEVSRQEMDIEKSMFWGTDRESGALTHLLTEKNNHATGDPNDPVNHLPRLMADVEERARETFKEKRRRRRRNRKLGPKTDTLLAEDNEEEPGGGIGCPTWEETLALKRSSVSSAVPTQSDRKVLKGPVEFLPVEYIAKNRLSLEEIQNLPKFANYEAGDPSSVLYVKNLSPRSSEQDLVSFFGRFQTKTESPIVYRLMTGRMRGQAFVTFDSSEAASQAMQLINGYLHHGKPVIVQYGRRTAA
ncbi:hypothetical protein ACOMHN_016850 [Nucella lapillus]